MQLVDSYIYEIGQHLPANQRQDILGELRDAIEEAVSEHAAQEGRAPNLDDETQVLQRFGHPLKVASQYQPQKYLIGPEIFPAFKQTLSTVLVACLALQIFFALLHGAANGWQVDFFDFLDISLSMFLWAGAVVVIVFFSIEYSGERLGWYDKWTPNSMSPHNIGIIDRGSVITNLLSEGFFLLWFNDVVLLQNYIPGIDDAIVLQLAPIWDLYFWPANIIFASFFAVHLFVLTRGLWTKSTLMAEITLGVAFLALTAIFIGNQELVLLPDTVSDNFQQNAQRVVRVSLLVIAGIAAWDIWVAFKVFRGVLLSHSDANDKV